MFRIRVLVLLVVMLGVMGAVITPGGRAVALGAPSCFGTRPTIVAQAGVVTNGTPGDDVISGTNGDDIIYGNGGNDLICGRSGDDVIYAYAPDEPLATDTCVDSIDLTDPYTIEVDGGSGNDVICGPSSSGGGYWSAQGGGGNDVVGYALGVNEDIDGGAGDDTMQGSLKYPGNVNSFSHAYGGSGQDNISAGEMFFYEPIPPTAYEVIADGGSGSDYVYGAAVYLLSGWLKGGPGTDTCERVRTPDPVELLFDASCETQIG